MNWLIWKEYRLNRVIIGFGLLILLLPHGVALVVGLRHPDNWTGYFRGSTAFSFYMSTLVMALLGGNAIAGERVDRSSEFLACLPISRRRNLVSKLVLAPLALIAIWGCNLAILLFVSGECPDPWSNISRFLSDACAADYWRLLVVLGCVGGTSLAFFCVAWLASSFLDSPVYAIAIGLLTPVMVFLGIQGVVWWTSTRFDGKWEDGFTLGTWYGGICIALSLVSFIAGTWCYMRRAEP